MEEPASKTSEVRKPKMEPMITLKTLAQASEQEVFDQVATYLLKQGMRSSDKSGNCKYRHEGLRCAAGCLIGDDEYDPSMEVNSWDRLTATSKAPKDHADLIVSLQAIHDDCNPLDWKGHLKVLAVNSNLKWNL